MVGSSKILTVSYGTFSCTLEGFDDPFVTMKSIAEYFRDLAADDRFFGAEPPQPDVQHLHALAQQNTLARVDAVPEQNGVVLRQESPDGGHRTEPTVQHDTPAASTPATPSPEFAVPTMTRAAQPDAAAPAPTAPVAEKPAETLVETLGAKSIPETDFESLVADSTDNEPADDDLGNLFDVSSDESTAAANKLASARAAVDAFTDPKSDTPLDAETDDDPVETSDENQRRRGLALSLTDNDLADASARPARPRQRPDAFTLTADDLQPGAGSSLSAEAEADLMAELAALEAEDRPAPTPAAPTPATPARAKAGRAILESDMIEREDAAIDRLLAKTNSKLSDDNVQQKRDQLSHLKAAVAATMADRASDAAADETADADTAYRDDLAKVVQPKPGAPTTSDQPTAAERHAAVLAAKQAQSAQQTPAKPSASADTKSAPLVLVSDTAPKPAATAQPRRPVRPARPEGEAIAPRRINRNDPNRNAEASETKARFADYADKVGAHDLSDLLEAAGAFLNTVEGKPVFTRPQIMQMVLRQDEGKRFTREDSLRGFDNLVRKGAIQRVDRGQFAIASESRFVS